MKKAVIIDAYSHPNQEASFEMQRKIFEENGIEFVQLNCRSEQEIIDQCRDADAVLNVFGRLNANVIDHLEKCKVIVMYAIGVDLVDIEAAGKKGIPVCNIPGYCTEEVATHTLALMLAVERKICLYNSSVRTGEWNFHVGYKSRRLSGRTYGFVGFGKIGQQMAKLLQGFDMRLVGYDPFTPDSVFQALGVERMDKDSVFHEADYIAPHVSLTPDTYHLFDDEAINHKMKDGVVILNSSRGAVIDEAALIRGLQSGKVRGAGLDVCESEPIHDPNHILYTFDNVVITPHAAYNSVEAVREMFTRVAWSAVKVLNGELPENVVNRKLLDEELWKSKK